jgi:hypothetical protein
MQSTIKMTKRNIIIAGIVLIAIALGGWKLARNTAAEDEHAGMLAVVVEPFEIHGGWGYKISVGGHPYIYQDVIPDVSGNRVFRSRENALKVGNVVAGKLAQNRIPSMSQQELIKMKITEAE